MHRAVATAVANELVRQGFAHAHYSFHGYKLDGVNIWILFKLFIVMPLSGLFAWWQTSLMQKYRLPAPSPTSNPRGQ
jgi:intracellular septation protein